MWQRPGLYAHSIISKELQIFMKFHQNARKRISSSVNSDLNNTNNDSSTIPSETEVVICGGGVLGAAVAYHLAIAGWGEKTVLFESSR